MSIKKADIEIPTYEVVAALEKCETCGVGSLYIMGLYSLVCAETVAQIHELATKGSDDGENHEIILKGYRKGDPWPEEDFVSAMRFFSN